TDGWKSDAVKESLDLCLACKGCKKDCPVHVDLATYKAEFLSHYYKTHLRPRHAFAFGLIQNWARAAVFAPTLVNAVTQTPGLSAAAKWAAGIAQARRIPAFAPRTFTTWYKRRAATTRDSARTRVLLWPYTFNNHFFPHTLTAAAEALEFVGCDVVIPDRHVCCGRPLYDFGMLDRARKLLRRDLDALRAEIEAGTPVVGVEPSCVSVFRDELLNLLPHDEDARRLHKQTMTLAEFLMRRVGEGARIPSLRRKAIVHTHCHHKAVMNATAVEEVLKTMSVDYKTLDSGCCGMAGSFGFERDKYKVSVAIGERVLLPAVRAADRHTIILADGFSCREQIAQTTTRRGLHLAELVQLALHPESLATSALPEIASRRLAPTALHQRGWQRERLAANALEVP